MTYLQLFTKKNNWSEVTLKVEKKIINYPSCKIKNVLIKKYRLKNIINLE